MNNIPKLFLIMLLLVSSELHAKDWWKGVLAEYPDPLTAPRVTNRCVDRATYRYPCPTWNSPGRMCDGWTCKGWATKTELLRVRPTFVVTGPDTADGAVRNAAVGIAATCGNAAVEAGREVMAGAPEPTSKIAGSYAAAKGAFALCIKGVTLSSAVAAVVDGFALTLKTPTHWARL